MNLSENPLWEAPVELNINIPSSTPCAPPAVPLCPKANNFIVQKGKTPPASVLAALLPAPTFLEDLNRSLQEPDDVPKLLERFEKEIRSFKCHICQFSCLGNIKLKKHMETNHPQGMMSTSPDPAMPSLGDYLASLEVKIELCSHTTH